MDFRTAQAKLMMIEMLASLTYLPEKIKQKLDELKEVFDLYLVDTDFVNNFIVGYIEGALAQLTNDAVSIRRAKFQVITNKEEE